MERREGFCGVRHRHSHHQLADDQSADDVDCRDDDTGYGVSLDELHGAVHGAV